MKDKSALIRIAQHKEGGISLDSKMQGRAAYICQDELCLKLAQKSKGLERSFKRQIPPEIYMQIADELSNKML